MAYNRVLLIRPDYKGSHYEYVGLPAGLGFISEALDREGIRQEVVDMLLGYDYSYLKRRIQSFNPDLIGINLMSFRYKDHYGLLKKIKADFPHTAVIAGGPHISTFRERAMEECPEIDFGATLEGEETLTELCKGTLAPAEIRGLLYRESRSVLYSGDRQLQGELDKIGFPRYRFFEAGKYPQFISLATSRGCPHSCIFCPVQLTIGRKLRMRSQSSVADELEYWYSKGLRVFNIVDDNFTFHKQRVLGICDEIKHRGLKGLTLSCRNGVRADTVDKDMLQKMKEAGFNYLAFGIESGSDRILKLIKKGETLAQMHTAVREACSLGFMVTLFFIIGLPYETPDDVRKSFEFAKKYPVFDARFYNLIPFPGTELYAWIEKNGYFDEKRKDYLNTFSHWNNEPVFGTPELPVALRKKLHRELNSEIRKHTLKTKLSFLNETQGLFTEMGVPKVLSRALARIYYLPFFQDHFIESRAAHWIKRILKFKK